MALTTFTGPVRSLKGFISGVQNYVNLTTTTLTLTPRDNGETTVIGNTLAVITLPSAANRDAIGLTYNFTFSVNAAVGCKIKTATTSPGDKFAGQLFVAAPNGAASLFFPNGVTNDVISFGTTAGGAVGSTLTIVCTALNVWTVSGSLIASGAGTQPFTDS